MPKKSSWQRGRGARPPPNWFPFSSFVSATRSSLRRRRQHCGYRDVETLRLVSATLCQSSELDRLPALHAEMCTTNIVITTTIIIISSQFALQSISQSICLSNNRQVIQGSQGAPTVALIIKETKALHIKMGISCPQSVAQRRHTMYS